jgi:ubiquinone/menaquinone biosynthesis C-methylase UbiE
VDRMSASLLQWICCPFCGGCLKSAHDGSDGFGVLTCRCGRYPVVADIPVIKRGVIGTSGETVDDVTRLVEAGRRQDALNAMLMPPAPRVPALAPPWLRLFGGIRGIRRLPHGVHERAARRWRDRMGAVFAAGTKQTTVCELLDLYYRKSGYGWHDAYDYFTLRFGQPRHLVALSFATLIRHPRKPVLDLACGFGHVTRTLARRAGVQPVVGVDETFFGLYVAKHFIAPEAEYVCSVGDTALPFRDGTFSVAFCSDAFHYFANKMTAARELKRLTQDEGTIVMAWMHNVHFRVPHDGLPLPPEGYEALMADIPYRIVADSEVLTRYLRKEGPPLLRLRRTAFPRAARLDCRVAFYGALQGPRSVPGVAARRGPGRHQPAVWNRSSEHRWQHSAVSRISIGLLRTRACRIGGVPARGGHDRLADARRSVGGEPYSGRRAPGRAVRGGRHAGALQVMFVAVAAF